MLSRGVIISGKNDSVAIYGRILCGNQLGRDLPQRLPNLSARAVTSEFADNSADDVGRFSSIALDGSGNPHISYYDDTNADLVYTPKSGGTWLKETVDDPDDVAFNEVAHAGGADALVTGNPRHFAGRPTLASRWYRLRPL